MESDAPYGLNSAIAEDARPANVVRGSGQKASRRSFDLSQSVGLLLSAAGPRDYRLSFYATVTALVTLFLALALPGPCLQLYYGHDSIGFLNGAWKVYCGLKPHTDFSTPLGALNPWIYAAAMHLLGPTAAVIPFCNGLFAAVVGLVAWVVAKPRLPALPAALFAGTQAIVAAAPHQMRWAWDYTTYACYYNRQGSALAAVLLLLLLSPHRAGMDRRSACREGVIAGAVLGVLLFLKISYFAVGGGLCALAIVGGHRFPRAFWASLSAGFAVAMTACLPLIHFDLAAMAADLRVAGNARSACPEVAPTLSNLLGWLPDAWIEIALLATLRYMVSPQTFGRLRAVGPEVPGGPAPGWLDFAGLLGLDMIIGVTNTPAGIHSETPVLTSWLFVLLGYSLARPPAAARQGRSFLLTFCSLSGILWVYTFGIGTLNLGWSVLRPQTTWRQAALHFSPPFDSDALAGLRMFACGGDAPMPFTYAQKVNDGMRLLRRLGGVHRVEDFDFVNPFPFAMQWPPAHGGLWCWHKGYSFSETSHPTPQQAFGDADILMVPKYPGEPSSFDAMGLLYSDYVATHFMLVEESNQWHVLRRK